MFCYSRIWFNPSIFNMEIADNPILDQLAELTRRIKSAELTQSFESKDIRLV